VFYWALADKVAARGWANARQFAKGAGISYPVAWQILLGGPIGRIDCVTLDRLARVFDCSPWELLDYRRE